jgi:hypothetical protein
MGDVANKDEALKCLDIAAAALQARDHARAEKFAAKALRLYRCEKVGNGRRLPVCSAAARAHAMSHCT